MLDLKPITNAGGVVDRTALGASVKATCPHGEEYAIGVPDELLDKPGAIAVLAAKAMSITSGRRCKCGGPA